MKASPVSLVPLFLLGSLSACGLDPDLAAPTGAQAAALATTWSTEQKLVSASPAAGNVRTAINDAGVAVVVFDQTIATNVTQVQAAVRTGGVWSAVAPLSDPALTAQGSAAAVDAAGHVTVAFTAGGALYETSWSAGTWTAPAQLPVSPGYDTLLGLRATAAGELQAIAAARRTVGSIGRPATIDLQALVKTTGTWGAPAQLTATPVAVVGGLGFHMNPAGQALVHAGFNVFRSPAPGRWGTGEVIPAGAGQVYTSSAALDEGGRSYFVFMKRYGGTLLSTAALGAAFGTPKAISKLTPLGSTVSVVAASPDHALIFGVDYSTYKARATATADGGKTWGGLLTLGGGAYSTDLLSAAGSTSGLYAVSFSSDGNALWVATGSGLGSGAAAWTKQRLAVNYALGSAAVAGTEVVAGWARGTNASLSSYVVGAASGVVTP